MKLEEIYQTIESLEFEANIMLASGTNLFNTIMRRDEAVQLLRKLCQDNKSNQQAIYKRLQNLLSNPVAEGYLHPNDITIATYLWILTATNTTLALEAANEVLTNKHMHWGRIIAKDTIELLHQPN